MKIGIVTPTIYPSPNNGYAGLEAVVGALAMELDNLGHEIYLFAPTGSYVPKNGHLYSPGMPGTVDELTAFHMYSNNEQSRKALLSCDYLHDQSWTYVSYQLRNVPEFTGKILHSHHGMDCGFRVQPPWPDMNLIGISASHAAALAEQSKRTWRFCYNGTDPGLYYYSETKSDRLLFLSRIWPFKGSLEAVKYAEEVKMPIDIVGGSFGDNLPENKAYVDLVKSTCEKSQYAKFHGEVDHATKRRLLSQAKAVLLPIQASQNGVGGTWKEPLGLISQECALSGTPIIVGANGGYIETVAHGYSGFLCNNKEDYMDALSRIDELDPKECRKQGEKFTSARMAREYLRLYKAKPW